MWIWFVVAAFAAVILPPCHGVDIPDVTTIYDVKNICKPPQLRNSIEDPWFESDSPSGHDESTPKIQDDYESCNRSVSGKVYKRTNALGLDLFLNEDKIEFDLSGSSLSCEVGYSCDWEFTGWTETHSFSGLGSPVKNGTTFAISDGTTLQFSRGLSTNDNNKEILLVLTHTDGNIRSHGDFHVMRLFAKDNNGRSLYRYNCYSGGSMWNITDRDGMNTFVGCNYEYGTYDVYYNSTLRFVSYSSRVRVYANGSTNAMVDINTNYRKNFLAVYYRHKPSGIRVSGPTPVKRSVVEGSSIVSPSFIPKSKNICLTLVLNCSTDTKSNVLRISAADLYQTEHILYNINNLKAGWQVKHVNIEINGKMASPIKITIRKMTPVEVEIQRISSCSERGAEVQTLPSVDTESSLGLRGRLPAYTATSNTMPIIEETPDYLDSCLNGGVMTTSGCACPPGFTGESCDIGCGRNKFGQDCRGRCSYRSRGCEGFLVCSPFTGCKCAPGYRGDNCKTECSEGWYGNDCEQRCGHCVEGESCNKYSGECQSCDVGYLPPYCRQEYVYYSLQPNVVSEKYKTITVSFNLGEGIKGVGEPKLYQIQYREKYAQEWKIHTIKSVPDESMVTSTEESKIKETIEDLKVGTLYEVRVLLMDASFNKYDGDRVEVSEVLTKCDIPDDFDYKVQSSSNTTALTFTWDYEVGNHHWCPVELYEVSWIENDVWITDSTDAPIYTLTDFEPGLTIDFRVRAKTTGGFAPYSKVLSTSTDHHGTSSVRDLRMISSQSTAVDITWHPPLDSEDRPLKYKITFKCVTQVACAPGCKDALEGQLTQEGTSVTLSALLPFTQYLVIVTPENGPQSKLYAGTTEAVPTEAPVLSNQKPVRSNSSITVFWEPVSVCSSFLKGYTYQLTKASESMKLLASGFTKDTSMSFYNLTASTDYVVKVFINTVAGWNPDVFLSIKISTSATVPDAVQNLTVYKRGRTMLGLRWMEPKYLYGQLKSFTIQHSLGKDVISETVEPKHRVVWPEYYCHTLENLKANRKYNVMVSARNMDMPEDGAVASLTTITKESAPLPPENLNVLNRSSTSVSLQWKHPSLINGVLRSFLVNVEESEKFDQDSCCQDYPLVELQVKEEKEFYEVEVSGLHPASTYYMSVSAKTISMGPSQSLAVYTRPPHLPVSVLPTWSLLSDIEEFNQVEEEVEWLPQTNLPEVNKSETFAPLIRAHIMLATLNNSQENAFSPLEAGVKDEQLLTLLDDSISGPFWFITEYRDEELEADSEWGEKPADVSPIGDEQYQLIAVQISDYNGVLNVDLRYSSPLSL